MKKQFHLIDQKIIAGMDRGATFITATRRLSRWLRVEDDRRHKAAGDVAWTPPEIVPWPAWLERCWLRLRDWGRIEGDEKILTERQESLLWRQILDDLPVISHVLMPGDLAAEAARAWALMQSYEIELDSIVTEGGEDARAFAQAAVAFAERCRVGHWVDRASLAGQMSGRHAEALAQFLPREIVLIGFDVLTPAQKTFLNEISKSGLTVTLINSEREDVVTRKMACTDSRDELLTIANWARELLEKNVHTSIGVAFPDLEIRAHELADVFDDVLAPASVLPGHVHDRRVWNQSLGRSLADWPVIDAALRALRLATAPVSFRDIGLLMRSPYIGEHPEESGSRARLDVWIREQGFFEMSLEALMTELAKNPVRRRPACPLFAMRLQDALAVWSDSGGRKPPGEWSRLFADFLVALGWPGSRTIDSSEIQIVARFHHELASMTSLDSIAGAVGRNEAVGLVSRIAGETMFQPEQAVVPVQVLGLLETTGLVFDHLWVAGFSHRNWPRSIKPNSLLPAGLQRKMRLPRSCTETELVFGRQLVDRLCGAASEVTFSWNEQTEHEALRPSPLLPPEAVLTAQAAKTTKGAAWQSLGSAKLETITDCRLPTLPADSVMAGGTAILKSQSACAFQAQARFRLGSSALESPHPGLDRRVGGHIAHRALERLWRNWCGLDGLMNAANWQEQVSDALAQAIRGLRLGQRVGREVVLQIERERLSRLIGLLLDEERKRDDFEVIETEKSVSIDLPGLTLRTRSDRVDRLASGATMIVDYKSGAAKAGDWLGDRPIDPQLPIYALGSDRPPDGLAFASLKAGQVGYRGILSASAGVPGVRSVDETRGLPEGVGEWSELLGFWHRSVQKLADEFTQGHAAVAPRDNTVCRYCELTALCRRHELARDQRRADD
jgi:ATP-dependent helicase/nuclease subunit B